MDRLRRISGIWKPQQEIVGLIKVILALMYEEIPPQLHFERLNRYISLADTPFAIAVTSEPWPGERGQRLAGVSSFGFAGTNAHVVLQEAPARENAAETAESTLHVLTLSAASKQALQMLSGLYARRFQHEDERQSLGDICYTASTGRSHLKHRLAITAASAREFASLLLRFASEGEAAAPGLFYGVRSGHDGPPIAFVFSGDGSQYAGAGRELYETQPAFRRVVDRCNAVFSSMTRVSLLPPGELKSAGPQDCALPWLFAVQMGLAEIWRQWGVEPAFVEGQGAGEYAASCTAGVFSLEDGARLVTARGRATYQQTAHAVRYAAPQVTVTSGGRAVGNEIANADYWIERASKAAPPAEEPASSRQQGAGIFIMLGANELRHRSSAADGGGHWFACLRRGISETRQLLECLAGLHVRGAYVDWAGFHQGQQRQRVALPTYPFERTRSWLLASNKAGAGTEGADGGLPLLGRRLHLATRQNELIFELRLSEELPNTWATMA